MPTMSVRNFLKRRARCITARSSTARSTVRPLPTRPKSCTRKGSSFTRCPCCPTSATRQRVRRLRPRRTPDPRSLRPQQQHDPDHDQHDTDGFAGCRRLLERKTRDRLREQHLDERQRAHAGGGGKREGEEPEREAYTPPDPGKQRRRQRPNDGGEEGGIAKRKKKQQNPHLQKEPAHHRPVPRHHIARPAWAQFRSGKADRREREH